MDDSGAVAGWIVICTFAFVVGGIGSLIVRKFKVVRR